MEEDTSNKNHHPRADRRNNATDSNNNTRSRRRHRPPPSKVESYSMKPPPLPPPLQQQTDDDDDDDDTPICFICAEKIRISSRGKCNHVSCHVCALRMRSLYNTRVCVHCRNEEPLLIFSSCRENFGKRFEEFDLVKDIKVQDKQLGIAFDSQDAYTATLDLLKFNCPYKNCSFVGHDWRDLKNHVHNIHHLNFCDICVKNKKIFAHEHQLFTQRQLQIHKESGDYQQYGFKGHPMCEFCHLRFYDGDALFAHCREKHERCFVCDREQANTPAGVDSHNYYENYDKLEQHFRNDHFLCPMARCLDEKFVVFSSILDLQAHQLKKHPELAAGLGKSARIIPVHTLTAQSANGHSNDNNRRRNNNNNNNNRRRQEPEHPEPSSGNRSNFGSQITSNAILEAAAEKKGPTNSVNPEEAAKHKELDDRVQVLLNSDDALHGEYRKTNTNFKRGFISGNDLIESYKLIFPKDTLDNHQLEYLVTMFARLFHRIDPEKEKVLDKAWNDYSSRQPYYPSLEESFANSRISSSSGPSNNSGNMTVLHGSWAINQTAKNTKPKQQRGGTPILSPQPQRQPQRPSSSASASSSPGNWTASSSARSSPRGYFPPLPPVVRKVPPLARKKTGPETNAWGAAATDGDNHNNSQQQQQRKGRKGKQTLLFTNRVR